MIITRRRALLPAVLAVLTPGLFVKTAQAFPPRYHEWLTRKVLTKYHPSPDSTDAINRIVTANLDQDNESIVPYSPTDHGDNCTVKETIDLIRKRIKHAQGMLNNTKEPIDNVQDDILIELGRAFHAIQDLVSHTDYLEKNVMDYSEPNEVPIPDFYNRGSQGLISGSWDGTWNRRGTPGKPSHYDIATDVDRLRSYGYYTPHGAEVVPGMGGVSWHKLAMNVAERETESLYHDFLRGLTKSGKERWEEITTSWDLKVQRVYIFNKTTFQLELYREGSIDKDLSNAIKKYNEEVSSKRHLIIGPIDNRETEEVIDLDTSQELLVTREDELAKSNLVFVFDLSKLDIILNKTSLRRCKEQGIIKDCVSIKYFAPKPNNSEEEKVQKEIIIPTHIPIVIFDNNTAYYVNPSRAWKCYSLFLE